MTDFNWPRWENGNEFIMDIPRPQDCEYKRNWNKPNCCPYRKRMRHEPPPIPMKAIHKQMNDAIERVENEAKAWKRACMCILFIGVPLFIWLYIG